MKTMYYLEICDTTAISGGVYPLGELTEKQALKECKKRIKSLWRQDKKQHRRIKYNLCTDEDAFDMVYCIELSEGYIRVYDWRTEEYVEDTRQERIDRLSKEIDECFVKMQEYIDNITESRQ